MPAGEHKNHVGLLRIMGRIDTHIHAFPPAYVAAVEAAGGDPSGFPSPDWSLEATFSSMNSISTSKGN